MAESQSETSFEPIYDEALVIQEPAVQQQLMEGLESLRQQISEQRKIVTAQEESLNWTSAILAVLLQEAGGAVVVSKADLEGIKLKKEMARIIQNDDDTYTIEAILDEEETDGSD